MPEKIVSIPIQGKEVNKNCANEILLKWDFLYDLTSLSSALCVVSIVELFYCFLSKYRDNLVPNPGIL